MKAMDARHYLLEVNLLREKVPSFDEYPFSLPIVRGFGKLTLHPKVTFLVGENGSGKSTLLEAIAIAWGLNPEGGSRNINFSTLSSHSRLHECLRLVKGINRPRDSYFLRAESLYNVATQIDRLDKEPGLGDGNRIINSYGGVSLHEQSHGESFFAVIKNRFGGQGLYLLDEPEAALSPTRQMSLITMMHDLVGRESQFLIATHSPIIMAYPDADIFMLSEGRMKKTEYTDTEHYAITKEFLNNYRRMLDILMED